MHRFAPVVLATLLAATTPAPNQAPTAGDHKAATAAFSDPANLRGERVSPRTGRELPIDRSEAQGGHGLQQMLRKLNTRASLMLIVAHPDDEDGGMLTLYSRGLGARVATLTLTRGEGGQNARTGDFEDALGLIRTQELLSADRYFDAGQMFGTEVDFGFSKTKEESFQKWGHERVLYDAVRAVRLYRPLVIAAVFIGGVTDGHGQHQVSGEIAQEVFNAAGDPRVFPELTAEGILPWQPLKVYARVPTFAISDKGLFDYATGQYAPARFTNYVTGEVSTTAPTPDVIVHEGETDPLLTDAAAGPGDLHGLHTDPNVPLSYVQFARIGLGLQRTQIGPGVRLARRGTFDVAYHLYGSRLCSAGNPVLSTGAKQSGETCVPPAPAKTSTAAHNPASSSFFDGIDTSIEGISSLSPAPFPPLTGALRKVSDAIALATSDFDPKRPGAVAPQLANALKTVDRAISLVQEFHLGTPDAKANILHELRIKRVQLNDALALALGLRFQAEAPASDLLVGTAVHVPTQLSAEAPGAALTDEAVSDKTSLDVEPAPARGERPVPLAPGHPLERQLALGSWQTTTVTEPYFFRTNIEQPVYQLRNPALRDAPSTPPALIAWAAVRYAGVEVRVGHVVTHGDQPVSFVPPASLSLSARAQVLLNAAPAALVSTTLYPVGKPPAVPKLSVPAGWKSSLAIRDTDAPGQTSFQLLAPAGNRTPIKVQASAKLPSDGTISQGFRAVGYPGIPLTNFYTPATDRIVPVELKLPTHRRIGYLQGTGDAIPEALASVGLPVTQLTVADLTPARLAQFDTVVLGVRTYNAHPDLHGVPTQALFEFARNGGNVVVQYQTYEFTGADAPYPLTLGNAEKVVDETDPVDLLKPGSPALSEPNRITSADFKGWIEERGHGFLHTWDPHYTAPTETHDPGQAPQLGGLITTDLGRGHWTYCAFALYRQLPEAVPGAFRLFVNLLGLADAPR